MTKDQKQEKCGCKTTKEEWENGIELLLTAWLAYQNASLSAKGEYDFEHPKKFIKNLLKSHTEKVRREERERIFSLVRQNYLSGVRNSHDLAELERKILNPEL